MRLSGPLALVVLLAGCSANAPPLAPISMEDAWQAGAPVDGLRLVHVEAYEWADREQMQRARAEARNDLHNATLTEADPQVGDGRSYVWWFRYVDDAQRLVIDRVVGPQGERFRQTDEVSQRFIDAVYPTELSWPGLDIGKLMAQVEDPLFGEWVARGANGTFGVFDLFGNSHLYYRLESRGQSHIWVFDGDGDYLGRDAVWPDGMGWMMQSFLRPTLTAPDEIVHTVHGFHDEMVVALEAHNPFQPSWGYVLRMTATAPDGASHSLRLDVGLEEDAVAVMRIRDVEPGDWTWRAEVERGLDIYAKITACAPGFIAHPDITACQHL